VYFLRTRLNEVLLLKSASYATATFSFKKHPDVTW